MKGIVEMNANDNCRTGSSERVTQMHRGAIRRLWRTGVHCMAEMAAQPEKSRACSAYPSGTLRYAIVDDPTVADPAVRDRCERVLLDSSPSPRYCLPGRRASGKGAVLAKEPASRTVSDHLIALLALCSVVVCGVPRVSHANPFGRLVKSIKIQKGPPSPRAAAPPSQGVPQQQAVPTQSLAQASPSAPPGDLQPAASTSKEHEAAKAPPATPSAASTPTGHPRCDKSSTAESTVSAADRAIALKLVDDDQSELRKVDLNGDGRPDFLLTGHDCGNMRVCGTDVFISQGEKYAKVFNTEDASFEEADDVSVGVGSGVTNGLCDLISGGMSYAWDGQNYKKSGKFHPPKKAKH